MPYIQTLPDTFTTPAYYSDKEMLLLPAQLRKKAEKKITELQQTYARLKSLLDLYWTELGLVFSFNNFCWAWYCVNSRSVYFKTETFDCVRDDGNHVALAPFLDLLNHSCKAKIEAGFNTKTKCYEIRTLDKYRKYEQVFISYGPHDNHHLLIEYGFTLPDNSYDTYELDFGKLFFNLDRITKSF
ncbi:hypothetical protein FSP39_001386 [Pinctada imbricata]|uniref:SET domain-containing protein n=1 Tax=Pinctada imbricata TaxID=66713 RepID=A0AA89BW39_PINIB|nr:hypothetical protein FSP39_001386 [Pinctada imbricata]